MKQKFLLKVRVIALFLGISLFAISCQDNATQTDVNSKSDASQYQGILTNENDEPIEGAIIFAEDNGQILCTDTTMTDGSFILINLPKDKSNVTLQGSHFKFQNFKIKIQDLINAKDFVKFLKIKMHYRDSCCGKLIFYVKDSTSGAAVSGANVKVSYGNIPIEIKKTDDHGRVAFENMCQGEYSLLIARDGYKVIKDAFQLGQCDTLEKTYNFTRSDSVQCCATLKVIVRDNETKQAIENAEVRLNGKENRFSEMKRTNADGITYFENICEGKYWIRVSREHYKVVEEDMTFEDCESKVIEIHMNKIIENTDTCCNNKASIILKNENGELINGATVKLWQGNHNIRTKTSENGTVLFGELCTGKYGVSVSREGYKPMEWDFTVTCEQSLEFSKTLVKNQDDTCCNNKVSIILKNENGELINGATVKLWQGNHNIRTKTSENGTVLFGELCTGKYGVSVSRDGYKPMEWDFTVTCEQSLEFSKTLVKNQADTCCNNKASIILKNENGELINGATVKLWQGNHNIRTKISENGTVLFGELCTGKYGVSVSREGYKPMEWDFTVTCEQSLEFSKTLIKNQIDTCETAIMKIKVRDSKEEPIVGAKVVISAPDGQTFDGYTGQDGYFVKEHLKAPVRYTITITKDGYQSMTFSWTLEHCDTYTKAIILQQ
ncbi:MAG: carboxypeptidase-like regulatory domain-containing protein [Chloroherpetonaceae bacterium]